LLIIIVDQFKYNLRNKKLLIIKIVCEYKIIIGL